MNYEIPEEQIKELAKGNAKVKKWFPEVFEEKLEIRKWYKDNSCSGSKYLVYVSEAIGKMNQNNSILGYGFSDNGDWTIYDCNRKAGSNKISLATESEVLEALTNEARRRGFIKGAYFKEFHINDRICQVGEIVYESDSLDLRSHGRCLYHNGKWAEIVKTHTKEEAEKILNAKII